MLALGSRAGRLVTDPALPPGRGDSERGLCSGPFHLLPPPVGRAPPPQCWSGGSSCCHCKGVATTHLAASRAPNIIWATSVQTFS